MHNVFKGINAKNPLGITESANSGGICTTYSMLCTMCRISQDRGLQHTIFTHKQYPGFMQAYAAEDYTTAMKKAGKFKCAMNLFWVNLYDSPAAGVPLVESRIKLLEDVCLRCSFECSCAFVVSHA